MSPVGKVPLQPPPFEGVNQVVADDLRFKKKLAIGENAYKSVPAFNKLRELWDVVGAAGTGAAVAKSTVVASTFFAPSGLLGLLGIGTAATPVGWIAFAALASGGACYGLYRLLGNAKASRVIEIPKFLNTPLDALGMALFDLIAPLSLRLAAVDGRIEPKERKFLIQHLVDEWGLDKKFVREAVRLIEPTILTHSIEEIAKELAEFLHSNPDCNHKAIVAELGDFLQEMLETGGPLSEHESEALALVQGVLQSTPPGKLVKYWQSAKDLAVQTTGKAKKSQPDTGSDTPPKPARKAALSPTRQTPP
jgi:hypothetical protein